MEKRLGVSLLLLRIGVFIVMLMWTMDKFVDPEHATSVFQAYYFFPDVGLWIAYVIGAVELVLILAFVAGYKKSFTYGAVMILNGISTISYMKQYFSPLEGANLLLFAEWPMLAACIALFLLHDKDRLWTV